MERKQTEAAVAASYILRLAMVVYKACKEKKKRLRRFLSGGVKCLNAKLWLSRNV